MNDDSQQLLDEFVAGDAGQIIRHVLCSGDDWSIADLKEIAQIHEVDLSESTLARIATLTVNTTVLANSDGSMGFTGNARERLTHIALALSLCPVHLVDYAICFDDDDAECAQVRIIHPSHDT